MSKLHMKSFVTVLTLAVIVSLVPVAAHASGAKPVVIAGSSALWQSAALGAYNGGTGDAQAVGGTNHWTSGKNKLSLVDSRVSPSNSDAATVWVVWDNSTLGLNGGPQIWIFAKVDSVVGDRCFFAVNPCQIVDTLNPVSNSDWNVGNGSQISSSLWGADVANLPSNVTAIVDTPSNVAVNVAATDIRPEDAWWAVARVNSKLGASTIGGSNSDGLDGLGYNSNNAAGQIPNFTTTTSCTALTYGEAVGTPIYSAYETTSTSTDAANVLAFNISGKDPVTCTTIPAWDVSSVGATPIVFVNGRENSLAGLVNASEYQLQQVFSGANVNASAFGLTAGSIDAYLREPLSGTMNTTEATVFRYPTLYSSNTALAQNVEGASQEAGVGTPTAGSTSNPLNLGNRYRAIGTGEEVHSVHYSTDGNGGTYNNSNHVDGIGYTFFSYGNVNELADSTKFGYITLNGVDPIFLSYQGGGNIDPGQPSFATYGQYGIVPGEAETTATTLPACENAIWKYGYSFPNVRNGTYRAWSTLRFVYGTALKTTITDLVTASNAFVVTSVPDYIPFAKVTIAAGKCGTAAFTDPGLLVWRSHYQQRDGAGNPLGKAPVNTDTADVGGDAGGSILIYESSALGVADTTTQLTQSGNANNLSPAVRPAGN